MVDMALRLTIDDDLLKCKCHLFGGRFRGGKVDGIWDKLRHYFPDPRRFMVSLVVLHHYYQSDSTVAAAATSSGCPFRSTDFMHLIASFSSSIHNCSRRRQRFLRIRRVCLRLLQQYNANPIPGG